MTLNTCHERLIVEIYLVERLKTFRVVLKGEPGLENIFLFLAAKSKIKISCGRHE